RLPGEVDAGRQDQPVVGDEVVAEGDAAPHGVDRGGARLHHAHAAPRDIRIVEALRLDVAQANDHLVAERAGDEGGARLHQHDVELRICTPQPARGGGAPEPATD